MRRIEEAMAVRDEGTVPCNNDLLAENFIDVGDGFRLIDYEYSGNNDACFELGNVWSESNLALSQLDEIVAHYYGRQLANKVARARLWGLMITALRHIPATRATVVAMIEPVLAGVVAYAWLGEEISAGQLIGGLLVLAAIVLAQTARGP